MVKILTSISDAKSIAVMMLAIIIIMMVVLSLIIIDLLVLKFSHDRFLIKGLLGPAHKHMSTPAWTSTQVHSSISRQHHLSLVVLSSPLSHFPPKFLFPKYCVCWNLCQIFCLANLSCHIWLSFKRHKGINNNDCLVVPSWYFWISMIMVVTTKRMTMISYDDEAVRHLLCTRRDSHWEWGFGKLTTLVWSASSGRETRLKIATGAAKKLLSSVKLP